MRPGQLVGLTQPESAFVLADFTGLVSHILNTTKAELCRSSARGLGCGLFCGANVPPHLTLSQGRGNDSQGRSRIRGGIAIGNAFDLFEPGGRLAITRGPVIPPGREGAAGANFGGVGDTAALELADLKEAPEEHR